MHIAVPENASRDIDVDGETFCPAPVHGLVEPTTEFKERHVLWPGNLIWIVARGEIFPPHGHEPVGFGECIGDDLVEKHDTLEDFGGVSLLFVDVGGQVGEGKFRGVCEGHAKRLFASCDFNGRDIANHVGAPGNGTAYGELLERGIMATIENEVGIVSSQSGFDFFALPNGGRHALGRNVTVF